MFGRVWSCLVVFDKNLKAIKDAIKNENISIVRVFDGRCFVRLDSRVSNMFDAGMRTTLAQQLTSIVSSVFDQTCFITVWPLTSTLACFVTKQCLMVFGRQTPSNIVW